MLNAYAFLTAYLHDATQRRSERGATATEYGLLVAFIAMAIVVGVTAFSDQLSGFFDRLGAEIATWNPGG